MPTTTVTAEQTDDMLPLEFLLLPEQDTKAIDATLPIFVSFCDGQGKRNPAYFRTGRFKGILG